MLFRSHLPINRVIASALYTGILTDSGKFMFHGVTPHTMEIVGKLFSYGIPAKEIIELCYHESEEEKAYKKWMKDHAVLDGQVCYLWAYPEDYASFGLSFEVADAIRLLAVTINPFSAYGFHFDKDEFMEQMSAAIRVPVINVREGM